MGCHDTPAAPQRGALVVSVQTTGGAPDVDGYTLTLPGRPSVTLPANGEVTVPDLAPGATTLTVSGVAANCTPGTDTAMAVTVAANGTAHVAVSVTCWGARLLFTGPGAQSGNGVAYSAVYVANPDGAGLRRLTADSVSESRAVASLDGSRIALVASALGRVSEVVVERPDGGGRSTVAVPLDGSSCRGGALTWDPSGTRITAWSGCTRVYSLYVVPVDAGAPSRAFTCYDGLPQPTWSPDGHRLAYAAACGGLLDVVSHVYLANPDGSGTAKLTNASLENDHSVAWSPDGSLLAFDRTPYGGSPQQTSIYTIRPDGSGLTLFTPSGAGPKWSPDGRRIAYTVTTGETTDLFVANADGSGARNLTSGRVPNLVGPQWSPDGTMLVAGNRTTLGADATTVVVVMADGSGVRTVYASDRGAGPVWLPVR